MLPSPLRVAGLVAFLQLVASNGLEGSGSDSGSGSVEEEEKDDGHIRLTMTYRTISSEELLVGATSAKVNNINGVQAGSILTIDPEGLAEKKIVTNFTAFESTRARRSVRGEIKFAQPLRARYRKGVAIQITTFVDSIAPVDTDPHSDTASIAAYAFADRNYQIDPCSKSVTPSVLGPAEENVCYVHQRGNGICTVGCNTEACKYDSGDCKCTWTSDCPAHQSCQVGDCVTDLKWKSCIETRCTTDADCSRGSSACGMGFGCAGSTCGHNCDAWCRDYFGESWISNGVSVSGPEGGEQCGCKLVDGVSDNRTYILLGCLLAGIAIVLGPGLIIFVVSKKWPTCCAAPWADGRQEKVHVRSSVVSPAAPEDDVEKAERKDTNPNLAQSLVDGLALGAVGAEEPGPQPGVAETAMPSGVDTTELAAPPTRVPSNGSYKQTTQPGAMASGGRAVDRPSIHARPAFVPSQKKPPQPRKSSTGSFSQPVEGGGFVQPVQGGGFVQPVQGGGFAKPVPGGGFAQPPLLTQPGAGGGDSRGSSASTDV